ncbi:MAG: HD domain-containing protein [Lachnospiraceae bacterium]|nr:HD domain-containing protein [Lachnospiraceae bacterium]
MRYLKDLREGDMLSETYLCKSKQVLQTKAGKSYYSLILQDKSGTVDGKIWDLGPGIDHFDSMDYIRVDAQVVSFQNSLQMNIRRVHKCHEGEYDPREYMPCTDKDVKEMYQELTCFIKSMKNEYLRTLASNYFIENKDAAKAFVNHSAAKAVHHGFIGGLLEHTVGVTRLCDYIAKNYPVVNRDLLLTAAMFHDVGKIQELSTFPENDYTDAGQLLGHIYIGAELVSSLAAEIPGFPEKLKHELMHCILAHHGELEFGSPKKPALVEALALSMADNLDAKLETMTELFNGTEEKGWLGFQKLFESNVRKTSEN